MSQESTIEIRVGLDENKVAETITWKASDQQESLDAEAMILSLWDKNDKNTLRIDLWTKDMTVDEMKFFYHQTLLTMADTLERSTGEHKMAATMRDFCEYFAEKLNIIQK
jgi:gliding motility-associated protein GldC